LIKEFGFEGVPIRILVRDNKFMYARKGLGDLKFESQKVVSRIQNYKKKVKSITYRRRLAGSRYLYRK